MSNTNNQAAPANVSIQVVPTEPVATVVQNVLQTSDCPCPDNLTAAECAEARDLANQIIENRSKRRELRKKMQQYPIFNSAYNFDPFAPFSSSTGPSIFKRFRDFIKWDKYFGTNDRTPGLGSSESCNIVILFIKVLLITAISPLRKISASFLFTAKA